MRWLKADRIWVHQMETLIFWLLHHISHCNDVNQGVSSNVKIIIRGQSDGNAQRWIINQLQSHRKHRHNHRKWCGSYVARRFRSIWSSLLHNIQEYLLLCFNIFIDPEQEGLFLKCNIWYFCYSADHKLGQALVWQLFLDTEWLTFWLNA